MKDPILEEIYEVCRQINEECSHDIERLIDRLKTPKHEAISHRVIPEDFQKMSDRSKSISTESQ